MDSEPGWPFLPRTTWRTYTPAFFFHLPSSVCPSRVFWLELFPTVSRILARFQSRYHLSHVRAHYQRRLGR